MVCQLQLVGMERKDLSEAFESALENDRAADVDRIETRACGSDNYDGIQYNIYGDFVPVMPIINVVAEVEGHGIEQMFHATDGEEPYLGVFVATFGLQDHPAFAP